MPRRVKFEKRFNYQKFLITFSYVTLNPKIKVSVETTLIQFPKVRKKIERQKQHHQVGGTKIYFRKNF